MHTGPLRKKETGWKINTDIDKFRILSRYDVYCRVERNSDVRIGKQKKKQMPYGNVCVFVRAEEKWQPEGTLSTHSVALKENI